MADIKGAKAAMGFKKAELATGGFGVAMLAILLLPVPAWGLDVLFLALIVVGMLTLFLSAMVSESMEFSAFPSILLLGTVARLAITVAATRSILVNGEAGMLVETIGDLFLGNNVTVGLAIFLIMVATQFMVVTGGTTRVSEVTARFTLDAMPGKQMAIDADLNAGLITEPEARARRKAIENEADFFGAMDGASKFVRGDAMASIIIVAINLAGGTIIGMVQGGMPAADAFLKFSQVTVGMGLVTQISSLLTSVTSGILVTRATSGSTLAGEIGSQIFSKPGPLWGVSGILGAAVLVPGSPKIVLMALSGLAAYAASQIKTAAVEAETAAETGKGKEAKKPEDSLSGFLQADLIDVEIGYALIAIIHKTEGGFMDKVESVRKTLARDLGLPVPPIHIKDDMTLAPNGYRIKLHETEVAKGDLRPYDLMAINPGSAKGAIAGEAIVEPVFSMQAVWIKPVQKAEAERLGYTVVDPVSVLVTHLTETLKKCSAEVLTRQQTQHLLDQARKTSPAVIEELTPGLLSLGETHRALQNLLRERVPIRSLPLILEAFADQARTSKDISALSEAARRSLSRAITTQHQSDNGMLEVHTLSPAWEQKLLASLHKTDGGIAITLPPRDIHSLVDSIAETVKNRIPQGTVLVCSSGLRYPLRRILERSLPSLPILSYEEIWPEAQVKILGKIDEPKPALV